MLVTLGQYGVMTGKAIGAHSHMHKTKVSRAVARAGTAQARDPPRQPRRTSASPSSRSPPAAAPCMRILRRWRWISPAGSSRCVDPADRAAFDRAITRLTERSARIAAEFANGRAQQRGGQVKLYSYFRSSAAYRVRIALNLKGFPTRRCRSIWSRTAGRTRARVPRHQPADARSRAGRFPTATSSCNRLPSSNISTRPIRSRRCCRRTRSSAPRYARFAQIIACDIHPLNNIGAAALPEKSLAHEQAEIDAWYHHWILEGFEASRR